MDMNVIITVIITVLQSTIVQTLCARHSAKGFIYTLSLNP